MLLSLDHNAIDTSSIASVIPLILTLSQAEFIILPILDADCRQTIRRWDGITSI